MIPAKAQEAQVTRPREQPRSIRHGYQRQRAPFALRCGAILIDYLIIAAILAFSTLIARMFGGGARSAGNSSELIGIIAAVTVAIFNLGVLAGVAGYTIGKWATGLRLERKDGGDLGIGRAFLRHFVGYPLSLIFFGLGFAIAAFSTRGRTLHDLIAGSLVVREGPLLRRPRR